MNDFFWVSFCRFINTRPPRTRTARQMGRYGRAAESAAKLLAKQHGLSPRDAWNSAVIAEFGDSKSLQTKGCPRDSFLALCELGVIKSCAQGTYTRSVKNKSYVVRALDALRLNPALASDEAALWRLSTGGAKKTLNGQMDVVTTLFRSGFIELHRS